MDFRSEEKSDCVDIRQIAALLDRCLQQPLVDALRNVLLQHNVLHADETPVSMLAPGKKKTHRAYVWAYCTTPFSDLSGVIYEFAPSRAGEHARNFLGDWQGKLVCDDYSGYKAGFNKGILEIGCMAHARRKFYDLHQANKSELAAQALEYIGQLYQVERTAKDLPPDKRQSIRNQKSEIRNQKSEIRNQKSESPAHCRCAASMDAGSPTKSAGWLRHSPSPELQHQTLESTDTLSRRWGCAH